MEFEGITEKIIGCAYKVYNTMGYGFLESVYEKCLLIELRKLVNYLVATETNVGLLINFGEDKVEIKRKVRVL